MLVDDKEKEEFDKAFIELKNKDDFKEYDKYLKDDEKNSLWMPGIILYLISGSFVWMSMFMFWTSNVQEDMLC